VVIAGGAEIVAGSLTVVLVIAMVAGAAAVWWAVRTTRRWRRRLSAVLTGVGRPGDRSRVMVGFASLPVTDVSWWAVQRDRHRMWRAVTTAERAVSGAVAADAPIGDLPALSRRLRRTAESVDATLCASGGSPGGTRQARQQVTEVILAAKQLHGAAVEALTSIAQPATSGLTDAVLVEVAALRHGLATVSTGVRR
jgi:hypothetical protein